MLDGLQMEKTKPQLGLMASIYWLAYHQIMYENSWNNISKKKLYEFTAIRPCYAVNITSANTTFRVLNTTAGNHV
jgi:hypothetical protein